jgi:hypothetical protein
MWGIISDIALIVVGGFALLIYWLQERRKISEAASLIVMQVEELQERMREIKTYICDGQLNATAFYEAQLLFKTDYWDKYKHYFIRKLDSFSFSTFDEFYSCACDVLAQQELMKNLQRNDFYLDQQTLINMEANLLLQTVNYISHNPVDNDKVVDGIMSACPAEMNTEQKNAITNFLRLSGNANKENDMNAFWSIYNKDKKTVIDAFNQNAFTPYTPVQIKISLEKALNQFDSIPIIGCDGYKKLKKIANRRF